jgi:GNAT superfamily N-acetyltransferase
LEDGDTWLVVAEIDDVICGVGLLHRAGEIRLCYVRPGFQRAGIGRATLAGLEAQAAAWGLTTLTLGSTIAARPFYEKSGYVSVGEPICGFGLVNCYPYAKSLRAIRP